MISELIQKFKIHLEEDGKSVKTIESYTASDFVAFPERKGVDFNIFAMTKRKSKNRKDKI